MSRFLVKSIGCSILLCCVACGQDVSSPFLWEVTPDGKNDRPSYVFGTIHTGLSANELAPAVWDALDASNAVIVEADVRTAISIEQLVKLAQLPDGHAAVDEILLPIAWKRLTTVLDELPEDRLRELRPWLLSMLVDQQLLPSSDEPMDLTLTSSAEHKHKRLVFLETFHELAAVLNELPINETTNDLISALLRPNGRALALEQLVSIYRQGDLETIRQRQAQRPDPTYGELVLGRRNENWLPRVEQELKRGGAFVAVGLDHLVGQYSLLTMVERKGYKARRLAATLH